jgi:hypothetical protein
MSVFSFFKEALALFLFSGKDAPNPVNPLDTAILSHWTP